MLGSFLGPYILNGSKGHAKKESSDEESSTSRSEDEEYAMAVKDFKKFFREEVDPNHLIGECLKPPKEKNKRAFVGGSWSYSSEEDDEKAKDETCLMAQASNELFSTYKAYNGGNVIFGSNLHSNIIGKGTISHGSLKIANVEHVDNLGFNLLSVGQICDSKCKVIFSKNASKIVKDGKVIRRGIRKKGLYVMKLGTKPEEKIYLATIDENSTLWHRRLGDANMRLIQSLASKELVRNFPKLNPSAVRSYGGNLNALVIVDDYSRTDHGREFDNEVQFGEFCNANGITHNFSAPHTPQSNGVVEKKNRALQEMSRTMLNE
ncbi:retrovirus-related pol polyprotein from transposon TNT 1-94 [Tanacetum coccineum]